LDKIKKTEQAKDVFIIHKGGRRGNSNMLSNIFFVFNNWFRV